MSIFCQSCGTEVASQYRFCPGCGGRDLQPGQPVTAAQPVVSALQQPALKSAMAQAVPPMQSPWSATSASQWVPASQAAGASYAGFWRRLLAYAIDLLLLGLVFAVIGLVIGVAAPGTDFERLEPAFNLLGMLVFWVYCANMESGPTQATIGKRAMGLRVVGEHSQPISFGRASGRFFGKVLSGLFLGIGFLMIAFTARKQALHDKLASTLVVRTGE